MWEKAGGLAGKESSGGVARIDIEVDLHSQIWRGNHSLAFRNGELWSAQLLKS